MLCPFHLFRVADVSLCAIAEHLSNLVYLDLGGCRNLTAVGFGALAGLTLLRHLNLQNTRTCANSTIALAKGCGELR